MTKIILVFKNGGWRQRGRKEWAKEGNNGRDKKKCEGYFYEVNEWMEGANIVKTTGSTI